MTTNQDDNLLADLLARLHQPEGLTGKDFIELIQAEVGDETLDTWANRVLTYSNHGSPLTISEMFDKLCQVYKIGAQNLILPQINSRWELAALLAVIEKRLGERNEPLQDGLTNDTQALCEHNESGDSPVSDRRPEGFNPTDWL